MSPEEIEALLHGGTGKESDNVADSLTEEERDAIGEIGNISFGTAATTLSSLLQHRVEITTPAVQVMRLDQVQADFPQPYVIVTVEYISGLSGVNALAIEIADAKTIADLMMGGDGTDVSQELNELHLSAVAEAMNQMMGGAATAMSTMFNRHINISPPQVRFVDMAHGERPDLGGADWVVNTAFRIRVGDLIDSRIMQWIPIPLAKGVLQLAGTAFGNMSGEAAIAAAAERVHQDSERKSELQARSESTRPALAYTAADKPMGDLQPVGETGRKPSTESPPSSMSRGDSGVRPGATEVSVQRPEYQDFNTGVTRGASSRNLSLLFDVQLSVTVELGRTKRPIREILDMVPGSILELDKLAGEPVDIFVNQKRIAVGEVVVIDENFGVRVTDILSAEERVRTFQT